MLLSYCFRQMCAVSLTLATEKIIQPGDVIQTDFGIKAYDIWCTDIQRFAYVLKPGETEPPPEIKEYFNNASTASGN